MVPVNFQLVRLVQQPRKLGLAINFPISFNEKAIQQYWNCTENWNLFGIKELDLSDTNQQRRSTDSIQTTSGIAQIFQNPVKDKKGANTK